MSEENLKNMNFFTRIITSIKDFDKYVIFATEKTSKAIAYLAILMLIFSLVLAGIMTNKATVSINKGIEYFRENINEITYKDENLSINFGEELEFINEQELISVIIIHTNASTEQQAKYLNTINNYDTGLVILKDKIIYKNQTIGQNIEKKNKDIVQKVFKKTELTKDDVLEFTSESNRIGYYAQFYTVMTIMTFLIFFGSTLLDTLILGILGFIFARIIGIRIKYKATFNMGAYALTLPIILNLIYVVVNAFTGFEVKYFQWMYTTISYIYMIVAILMIKTDLINRQAELMKIIEEQEKVREEIKLKEEQEKNEEERNKEEEQTKDKENKEEKEKNKGKNNKEGKEQSKNKDSNEGKEKSENKTNKEKGRNDDNKENKREKERRERNNLGNKRTSSSRNS